MGGIGKTTLTRKAHDNLPIRYHFDIRVWVTISQEYRGRNVLLDALHCILKQTNIVKENDYDTMDDCELADLVQKNLKGSRYLVVVDDIWSADVWDSRRVIFPNYNNGSRILLTTRETEVAIYANTSSPHEMNVLNLENSWK
ncbi:putative late blight resistance protein homolog R1A-3 [Nicotiana tabacum]|uniref:Late blight resistance protein homolog R1A-3 n=1 Tax=Nicotiana tabacum TaxID=4097 RepID=A0A1S3YE28_TOBAC